MKTETIETQALKATINERDELVNELIALRRENDSKLSDCESCGEQCKD